MELSGHGISARLPRHWEGAIVAQSPIDLGRSRFYSLGHDGPHGGAWDRDSGPESGRESGRESVGESADVLTAGPTTLVSLPVVHLANFALPAARGDFGSGAVETMGPADVFVALVEYGSENVGTPLFAHTGLPRMLHGGDFHPLALQRPLPGQAGYQEFFTTGDRAFCLYVVLGGVTSVRASVSAANAMLAGITIGSTP